ncbi:MAG TPA: VWA domain-containing protein, partial [Thermoanaerobaculia bacterium]|nr:VWA domain-containing protein [Thermoanaerobaculia bacterium]
MRTGMGTSSGRKAKLLAAFSLLAAFASAGEEPPRVKSSAELTLTNVDVVVTDRNGKHVEGLIAADFDVTQDGRPMVVTNFQEMRPDAPTRPSLPTPESAEAPPPAVPTVSAANPAAAPAEVRRPTRTVVVFVDRLRLPDANLRHDFFTSIGNLLRRVMGPTDRTMIVAWDRTVQSVTPFTSDLPTLEATLGRLEKASAGIPLEEATLDQLSQQAAWYSGNLSRGGSGNTGLTSRLLASQAFYEMQRKTAVLRGLTATLGGIEGKKILVLATHRFSRYAGLEFFLGKRALVSDPIGGDAHSFDTRELLETVVESANAHGVT